jgi:hypothetical protein
MAPSNQLLDSGTGFQPVYSSEEGYDLPDRAQQRMQKRRQQSKTAFSQVTENCIFAV